MEPLSEETYLGYQIKIYQDEDPASPREWDNLGTMGCFHRRYELGDKDHGYRFEDFGGWDALEDQLVENGAEVILPMIMLDHSGIWIKTTDFYEDPGGWDSGQIGFIFATKDAIRKEYGVKRVTQETRTKVKDILRGEVDTYSKYVNGEVYGYTISQGDEEDLEASWGYYGTADVIESAKHTIDYLVEDERLKRQKRTKALIKGKVPLIYREESA